MADPPNDLTLDVIRVEQAKLPQTPDAKDAKEEASLQEQQVLYLKEQINELTDLRGLRKTYAGRVYWFLVIWCLLLLIILVFQGFSISGFILSEATMVTLVGGTTASVIGLVGFIVRGLFGSFLGRPQFWRREK